MPDLKPFIVSGLALGGVYALSGVGLVVLYRTSGVLNFAYGAVGAVGALVAWDLMEHGGSEVLAVVACVAVASGLAGVYGFLVAPRFADREAVVKAAATVGYALMMLGASYLLWSDDARTLNLSTSDSGFTVGTVRVNVTQILAIGLAAVVVIVAAQFLRRSRLGTTMRALANDRELTSMLGVRARRVDLIVWVANGALAGVAGILFANLVELDAAALTFLVIGSMATAVIGRFRSLVATLAGGLGIGVLQSCVTPFASLTQYRDATPFVVAIVALLIFDRLGVIPGARRA
jgi:branched-chain amino acid transport system permease protein